MATTDGGKAPLIPNLGNCWRSVVSFASRPLYPWGKSPGNRWMAGRVGPWAGFDVLQKKENLLPPSGFKQRIVQLAHNILLIHSLTVYTLLRTERWRRELMWIWTDKCLFKKRGPSNGNAELLIERDAVSRGARLPTFRKPVLPHLQRLTLKMKTLRCSGTSKTTRPTSQRYVSSTRIINFL
jgi:hypothetical protein